MSWQTRAISMVGSFGTTTNAASIQTRSRLAWEVEPADPLNGQPAILAKNGGIDGFLTELTLMPTEGLEVVAFVNTRSILQTTRQPEGPAIPVARNILQALCRAPPG